MIANGITSYFKPKIESVRTELQSAVRIFSNQRTATPFRKINCSTWTLELADSSKCIVSDYVSILSMSLSCQVV